MFEWLKTSSGVYNLTFIVAMSSWLIGGIGLVAGFHLNKVKTIEAMDKAKKAESERIEIAGQLETANAKTAELEKILAPRQLSSEQRKNFIAALASTPKGPLTISYSNPQPETVAFVGQIRSLVMEAGFEVTAPTEYTLAYVIEAPPPWFISLVVFPGAEPPFAQSIERAFSSIGVKSGAADGTKITTPGNLKLYIGSR